MIFNNYLAGDLYSSEKFLYVEEKIDNIFIKERIENKSYISNDYIKMDDLIYIKFLHYNYSNKVQVGEIIINKKIKDKVINILKELFNNKYQINSFKLIDDYFLISNDNRNEVDVRSIKDNNSHAFFYRKVYGTNRLSKHSLGFAIDINPKENPYLPYLNGKYDYTNLSDEEIKYLYIRDKSNPHVITHDSLIYKLFNKNDFIWGGDWEYTKDYQHFEVNNE